MFAFPFYAFLIAYLIFLAIFALFSVANVYHLFSTGTFTLPAITITAVVTVWCIAVLAFTAISLVGIDWSTQVIIFGPAGIVSFDAYALR